MITYKKYDVGDSDATGVVIAGGAQGNVSVDLTEVYNRIADVNSRATKNSEDIRTINNTLGRLDEDYINHGGDEDDGAYTFGQVISDDMRSPYFFTDGIGFRAYWDESGYTAIIKDIGISNITFTKVTGENTQLLNKGYTRVAVQKDNAITLTNTLQGASVYFKAGITTLPAGATITEEHCYVSMVKSMDQQSQPIPQLAPPQPPIGDDLIIPNISADTTTIYSSEAKDVAEVTGLNVDDIDVPVGPEVINGLWVELYKDGQDWVLRLDTSGHECTYSLRYEAIIYYSNEQLQTYVQPYIKGNVTDNTTRYYGGTSKQTIATPTDVTVIEGNNGMRMTNTNIQKTTDGGQTWTNVL